MARLKYILTKHFEQHQIHYLFDGYYSDMFWRAPEHIRNPVVKGSQKGDVYSFGIILHETFGRAGPYGFSNMSPKGKSKWLYEPSIEIVALLVLRKLIFLTRMRSHRVGLDFWSNSLSTSILYLCEQRRLLRDCTDAQARLCLHWSPM